MMIITSESRLTLTRVAIMSINAGAAVLARTRLALILLLLAVLSHPTSFTLTVVPEHKRKACTGYKVELV